MGLGRREGRDGVRAGLTPEEEGAIRRGRRYLAKRTLERLEAGRSIYDLAAEAGWDPGDLARLVAPIMVQQGTLPMSAIRYIGR